ncbi:hypothetical protein ACRYCC_40455 [Actinomadura scrupuli]|uniref:hypothetical protein n=1 Tax=Actinomadura scrupuli TaxID=559629 RepID=UPI003D9530E9
MLLAGLFISALLGSMTGLYLNEDESGLDHLSQPITLWGLVLSGLILAFAPA